MLDYIRIACAVPPVRVGDVKKNTEDICNKILMSVSPINMIFSLLMTLYP